MDETAKSRPTCGRLDEGLKSPADPQMEADQVHPDADTTAMPTGTRNVVPPPDDESAADDRSVIDDESAVDGKSVADGESVTDEIKAEERGGIQNVKRATTIPPWATHTVGAILALGLGLALVWGGAVLIPSRIRPPTPTVAPTPTDTPRPTNTAAPKPSPTTRTLADSKRPPPSSQPRAACGAILVADFQDLSEGAYRAAVPGAANPAELIAERLSAELVAQGTDTHAVCGAIERLRQVVDEDTVRSAGQAHNAAYVLWGWYDAQGITPRLQRIKTPSEYRAFGAEGQRLDLSEPETIGVCPLTSLPDQITYLTLFVLGISAYSQREDDQALKYLAAALAAIPEGGEPRAEGKPTEWGREACPTDLIAAQLYLGNVYALRADYDAALASYTLALDLVVQRRGVADPSSLGSAAATAQATRMVREAYLVRANLFAQAAITLYVNRANTYHAMGEYESALADLDRALELNPEDVNAYYIRGNIHRTMDRYRAALVDYAQVLELDPDHTRAYASRGLVYHNMGEYEAALADYSRALELNPDAAEVYLNRGGTYASMGNYGAALKDYDRSLELNSRDADAYYNRGTVHAIIENYEQALADLNRALELNPEFAQVYGNRGLVYKALGQTDKAIADLERFLELSDNPQWRQMIEQQLRELRGE